MGHLNIGGDYQICGIVWHGRALCTSEAFRCREEGQSAVLAFSYEARVWPQHTLEEDERPEAVYCVGRPEAVCIGSHFEQLPSQCE